MADGAGAPDGGDAVRVTGPGDAPPRRPASGRGLRARVLAGGEAGGAPRTGLVEIDIEPGASLPEHDHGEAEALAYVVDGRARVSSGDRSEDVVGGAAVHVPRGAKVAIANTGSDRLRLLVSFSPAGFEQRFTSWEWALGDDAASRPQALLDLTGLPRPQRHRTVIAALEALDARVPLVVVNDHEPAGLQRQLERRYEGRLGWEVRARTGDRVAVAIWLESPPRAGDAALALAVGAPAPTAA